MNLIVNDRHKGILKASPVENSISVNTKFSYAKKAIMINVQVVIMSFNLILKNTVGIRHINKTEMHCLFVFYVNKQIKQEKVFIYTIF